MASDALLSVTIIDFAAYLVRCEAESRGALPNPS
jgi:hypothetical protein